MYKFEHSNNTSRITPKRNNNTKLRRCSSARTMCDESRNSEIRTQNKIKTSNKRSSSIYTKETETSEEQKDYLEHIEKEKLCEESLKNILIKNKYKEKLLKVEEEYAKKKEHLKDLNNKIIEVIEKSERSLYKYEEDKGIQNMKLIRKLNERCKEVKTDLEIQKISREKYECNMTITQLNELNIENQIYDEHKKLILLLFEHLNKIEVEQSNKIVNENEVNKQKIKQNLLMKHFENKINDEIIQLNQNTIINNKNEKELLALQSVYKKIDNENLNLKNKYNLLQENFIKKKQKNNISSKQQRVILYDKLNTLNKEKESLKSLINANHLFLNNNKDRNTILEKQLKDYEAQLLESRYNFMNSHKNTNTNKENKSDCINKEDEIKQLKEILKNNKKKEKELEAYINELSYKVDENIDQCDLGSHNPYVTEDDNNDILQSNKITVEQYITLFYILFKTFQAKKIEKDYVEKNIFDNIFFYINSKDNDTPEKKKQNLINKILESINITNNNDKLYLNILFNALFYSKSQNYEKIKANFLNYFNNYNSNFNEENENKFISELDKANINKLWNIYNTITNSHKDKKYISIFDLKVICENDFQKIEYDLLEFVIYYMKKFNDKNASFTELQIDNISNLIHLIEKNNSKHESKINNTKVKDIENNDEPNEVNENEFYNKIQQICNMINDFLQTNNLQLNQLIKDDIIVQNSINLLDIQILKKKFEEVNLNMTDRDYSFILTKYQHKEFTTIINVNEFEKDLTKYFHINNSINKNIKLENDSLYSGLINKKTSKKGESATIGTNANISDTYNNEDDQSTIKNKNDNNNNKDKNNDNNNDNNNNDNNNNDNNNDNNNNNDYQNVHRNTVD